MVSILSWIGFGLVVALVAHIVDSGRARGGFGATALMGMTGGLVGGALATYFFRVDPTVFTLHNFLLAVVGSTILAILYRVVFQERGRMIRTQTHRTND